MTLSTTRYFIELAYDGTSFHGWQIQPNAVSVQELLDRALSTCFRTPVQTTGCGRTDTGVHATRFFAHFDLPESIGRAEQQVHAVNALLPYQIGVKRIFAVQADAHARFDATSRTYHYFIHTRKDPFRHQRSWLLRDELNLAAMNEAASRLFHHTDFSCFSKSNTQTFTNNCRISEAVFTALPDNGLQFTISADRFLRNMVRAIVGTLADVGRAKLSADAFDQIIESRNRSNAGQSVPACGLYLVNITYPYVNEWQQ
ncbi:tRNA pseudouridine(38-40) synthase TruA [Pedobacter sp. SYP-B3415]|uniref:tRNA pseudouridine(38-40) synthase TruA n=1 Tax=Pedobacter sp. SYP-B3415 TaxID=2496641 RepID=UPI00101C19DD|nr:tRNA pseudouridine(38-40) synthase TruA [Pedobacter sp. SYP-B3415]